MFTENFDGNKYISKIDGEISLTIERVEPNIYHSRNNFFDITAKIIPLDEYRTYTECISHKSVGKDRKLRKTTKLLNHNVQWLANMLEEKGFIRKSTPINK